MKKTIFWMLLVPMVLGIASCSDEIDNPVVVTDDKPFDYEQDMDLSVRPGDNFYNYVLGAWINSDNPSPSVGTQITYNLQNLFEQTVKESNDPLMAAIRQQAEESFTDDSKSVTLLKERLDMLEKVETVDQFYDAFATLHQLGYNPLFSVKIMMNEGRRVLGAFTTGGMGRLMEQVMTTKQAAYVEKYVPTFCNHLAALGYSDERIQQITENAIGVETLEQEAFRTSIYMVKHPEIFSSRRAMRMDIEELLVKIYGRMGMDYYGTQDRIMVDDEGLADLLELFLAADEIPEAVAILRDYMIYKVIEMDSNLVPSVNPDASLKNMGITAVFPLRYYTYQIMTETAGHEYIHRKECSAIMEQMRQLFIEHVDKLDWMSEATKVQAKKKAEMMEFYIGYPDKWNEAMHPQTVGSCLLETVTQTRQFAKKINLGLAGKSLDETGWDAWLTFAHFTTDNAFYSKGTNSLVILPAWLIAPRFDNTKNEATLYACATTFGHEMCHGFDSNGSQYDGGGNKMDWWTPEDKAAFKAKQQKLIALFNQLEAYPGQPANGEYTLGENMADYGGVTLALELYKQHMEQQGFRTKEMDEQIRKFFIAYAQAWKHDNERSVALLQNQYLTDVHSAAHNRINGMMRLQDDWYRLYDVKTTDKLYVAPEDRVKIW